MKKLLVVIAASMLTAATFGQGQVVFNTRVTASGIDAPVVLSSDSTKGPGTLTGANAATAELFLVSLNGVSKNTALTASQTAFRTGSDAASKYVNGPIVDVPGSNSGDTAVLIFRAWNGSASSLPAIGGQSDPFTVTLGGGALAPANLTGVKGFTYQVPEPSTIALGLLGAAALLIRRRK